VDLRWKGSVIWFILLQVQTTAAGPLFAVLFAPGTVVGGPVGSTSIKGLAGSCSMLRLLAR
jgi:hypothetical protein